MARCLRRRAQLGEQLPSRGRGVSMRTATMARRFACLMSVTAVLLVLMPSESLACPICFGDPDSPIVQGANWGVFTLLGVTGGVLSGFVGFFFHLMKRSRQALGHESELSDGSHGEGSAV